MSTTSAEIAEHPMLMKAFTKYVNEYLILMKKH
jgi:hypothetical protein